MMARFQTTHTYTFATEVEREDVTLDVTVTYTVSPYYPATYYQPAEGGDVELVSVTANGNDVALTDAEELILVRECLDRADADQADEAADYGDYRYDQYRDASAMEWMA